MEKSLLLPLAIGAAAIFCNATAFAQSWTQCRAVEFAEMQTMNKTEREELYCKNKQTMEVARKQETINVETASKITQLAAESGSLATLNKSKGYLQEAEKYGQHAAACSAENDRVLRLIRKGNAKVEPPKCK